MKIGKISSIKKETLTKGPSMERSLAERGWMRLPGTGVFKTPYKELDNTYRTGLDPNAAYIKRIQNEEARNLEIARVTELKNKLQAIFGDISLAPNSQFWNHAKSTGSNDTSHVKMVKLRDDADNLFNFNNPWEELTFAWLRVHPTIASSYEAWKRGEFPADTQFYVVDEDLETKLLFNKKIAINKAIVKLDGMVPSTRKKVARQLGLPVSDDAKDEVVYNQIDSFIKKSELKEGKFIGQDPVRIFDQFATMKEQLLTVKDLVKQAIDHSIIRVKNGGKLYRGDYELAKSEEEYIQFLMNDDNQEDLLSLDKDLKSKLIATV